MDILKWWIGWGILDWIRDSPWGKAVAGLILALLSMVWSSLSERPRLLHAAVGAASICILMIGYNVVYDELSPDMRVIPITERKEFLSQLHPDASVSFITSCTGEDPSSCRLAVEYRDLLATFFTPEPLIQVFVGPHDVELVNRLCLLTPDGTAKSVAVSNLRAAFQSIDIDPGLRSDGSLKPTEFKLLVGSRR